MRIAGYHHHIDSCTEEMKDCERRIDENRVGKQQILIRTRRAEAETLRQEADRCRAEADSSAILGTRERELGNWCHYLLEEAEAKQREANRETEKQMIFKNLYLYLYLYISAKLTMVIRG